MQGYTILASLLACAISVHAAPTSPKKPANEQEYYLKVEGLQNTSYTGLYLNSLHASAGSSNVTLSASKGPLGYLSDSYQYFQFGTDFPWGFSLYSDGDNSHPQQLAITTGALTPDFTFGREGLMWSNDTFGGWLVCETTTEAGTYPQLFFQLRESAAFPGCSLVLLRDEIPPTTASNFTLIDAGKPTAT